MAQMPPPRAETKCDVGFCGCRYDEHDAGGKCYGVKVVDGVVKECICKKYRRPS